MIDTAFILVGGAGERLKPFTLKTPKPLIEIGGKPILFWILKWLTMQGIHNIVLCVAYKPELFSLFVNDFNINANILFSKHLVDDTNSVALKKAINLYNDNVKTNDFLVINGDTIAGINIKNFFKIHTEESSLVTIAITHLFTNAGVVKLEKNKILSFNEKPMLHNILINSGYYIFNRETINFIHTDKFEIGLFPLLSKMGRLYGYHYHGFWYTFDTHNDLAGFDRVKNDWIKFRNTIH